MVTASLKCEDKYSIPQLVKEGSYEFTADEIGIVFPLHTWGVLSYIKLSEIMKANKQVSKQVKNRQYNPERKKGCPNRN